MFCFALAVPFIAAAQAVPGSLPGGDHKPNKQSYEHTHIVGMVFNERRRGADRSGLQSGISEMEIRGYEIRGLLHYGI